MAGAEAAACPVGKLMIKTTLYCEVVYVDGCWLNTKEHWCNNCEQVPKSPEYLAGIAMHGSLASGAEMVLGSAAGGGAAVLVEVESWVCRATS